MAATALVLSLVAAALLALPLALHLPLEVAGPFAAPLGGGLCVVALVLGAWAWRSRRGAGTPPGAARAAVLLSLAGLVSAVAVEQALIRRERSDRAARTAPHPERKTDDKQFDDTLQDNLNR